MDYLFKKCTDRRINKLCNLIIKRIIVSVYVKEVI